MSASSDVFPERKHLSNVNISPISSDVLYVRIRKMSGEEDIHQIMSSSRQMSRKPITNISENGNRSRSTMTDSGVTTNVSSQTVHKEQNASLSEAAHNSSDSTPCLKHAAENISRKASSIPSEKVNLCNNCSKSMLCYIFLVQDFLDSLAKEIIGDKTRNCLQCARQEVRNIVAQSDFKDELSVKSTVQKQSDHKENVKSTVQKQSDHKENVKSTVQKHSDLKRNVDLTPHKKTDHKSNTSRLKERRSGNRMFKEEGHNQVSERKEEVQGITNISQQNDMNTQKQHHTNFVNNTFPSDINNTETQYVPRANDENRVAIDTKIQQTSKICDNRNQQWTSGENQLVDKSMRDNQAECSSSVGYASNKNEHISQFYGNGNTQDLKPYQQTNGRPSYTSEFRTLKNRIQPNYQSVTPIIPENPRHSDPDSNAYESSPNLYREDLDGIISTLSTTERKIYDNARDTAGWESLTESQRLVVPSGNLITSEAFVTSCRNNAEAISCLVLGTSLLLCRTSRTLCVLVSEGVSTAFKHAFSAVFQVVQLVRSLDSLGTTKLALLEQPELGVTFEKLNIWRLVQFTKCVYLNPDTLVIQNCDELFCREELSAVPDIGWPDCFNSGVFVYSPSVHTFWQLLEFADKQGSYDGGDQGLLNSYFNSWSSDISKKLSFIYNLMANVSYTYSPAFRQFGRDVKIVQFHGSFKPWHVKFFTKTGQISPSSPVHPTYVQFVHIWLNIFRITVLRLLSQEIQSYVASQEVISAVETLRFFPLPSESESDFFLTPPSVRLRLAEKKLNRSISSSVSEARRRKSAEFFRHAATEDTTPQISLPEREKPESVVPESVVPESDVPESDVPESKPEEQKAEKVVFTESVSKEIAEESVSESDEVFKESKVEAKKETVKNKNALPGSEIGDYQGMKAWEQGRMDYEGSASSDNIIKRLKFLMNPKPK